MHGERLHGGPHKPQNYQNWGVGSCLGMGACTGQYGNIKKVQKQDLKSVKNVKECRDGCQKVRKQGRDDVIVKVNLHSPISTSFYITVAN